jgi:uncharacterized RDD family membrane protein YckC
MSYEGYQPQGGTPPPGYGAGPGGYGGPPQVVYASVGKRLAAVILDGLVGGIATIPGWIIFGIATAGAVGSADPHGRMTDEAATAFVGAVLLGYLVVFVGAFAVWLYNVYLLGRDGASLGKRWMKIKVLDPNGQPLGFGKAFAREFVKQLLGSLCFLIYLWPLFDAEKQGLHDKLFSTHVYDA